MRPDEEERFADFVRAHSATLFRTAYLMTGDYQRAEDVLQESLVRICQRWSRIDQMASPLAYSRKVVVNRAASWWHKKSSRETPMVLHHDPAWGGHLDEVVEHQRVWQAVLALPPRQRAVMVPDHGLEKQAIEFFPRRCLEATHLVRRQHPGHERGAVVVVSMRVGH